MKNTSFLAIFDTLFIISLIGFLLTKNSIIIFVSLPYYLGTSFSKYFKQKETIYAIGFMTLYVATYLTTNNFYLPFNI